MAMKVYLTLDYELFMGSKVGTVDNCLIRPTENLVRVLDKYGVKATFFVDAAYLYRLYTLGLVFPQLKNDHEKIAKQLSWLNDKGYDIQLHIHPQWFFANYDGEEWHLKETDYKLSDFDESTVVKLFVDSKNHLEEIVGNKACAFRAGGFSIQTFNNINGLFEKTGIIIDSSVLSARKSGCGPQSFDYTGVYPGTIYQFETDVAKPVEGGSFVELPITTCKLGLVAGLTGSLKYHLINETRRKKYGDGRPLWGKSSNMKPSIFSRLLNQANIRQMATFDSGGSQNLLKCFKKQKSKDVFVVLSHPKNLSYSSIIDLEEFIKYAASFSLFNIVSSLAGR